MRWYKVKLIAILLICLLGFVSCAAKSSVPVESSEKIEILYMGLLAENSMTGNPDLDGDGKADELYIEAIEGASEWDSMDVLNGKFRVEVNDTFVECYGDNVDPLFMIYSPDGKQLLLAVYDDGPSNDPQTLFFRYNGKNLQEVGMIPDDLRSAKIGDDGTIQCTFRADMIQTEYARGYYYWDGSKMVKREDDAYYYLDDSKWREESQIPLMLKKDITVYTQPSEESDSMVMTAQQVRNVATDAEAWVLLEAKDGMQGWLRVEQFQVPSESCTVFELFEGLNMAD